MIYSRLTKTLLTLASAAVMTVGVATSASAATGTNASSGANLTARPAAGVALDATGGKYMNGVAAGKLTVSGAKFVTTQKNNSGQEAGIYVVYGPKRSDYNTNPGAYYSATWVNKAGLYNSPSFTSGKFSGVNVNISPKYTTPVTKYGGGLSVDCRYDYSKSASWNTQNKREKCYIQTFSANGKYALGNNPKANEVQIEVRWNSK